MARLELTARFTVYISYANLLYPRLIHTLYRSLVREYSGYAVYGNYFYLISFPNIYFL